MKVHTLLLIAFSVVLTFTACKKGSDTSNASSDAQNATQLSVHSNDQVEVSNETDAVANDANLAIEDDSFFSGRMDSVASLICDAVVTKDSVNNQKKIIITYTGTNCMGNRTRTGTVTLSMTAGMHWKDAGAALTITYHNLKITRLKDNKSLTINGSETVINVSGGRLIKLSQLGTITHTISGTMSLTFDDGSQRTWQIAKKRVFTYNNGIVITTVGMHVEGNMTNVSEWGENRFGKAFTTSITQPLIVRQDCNFRLTSGEVTHHQLASTAVVTFGLDASGNSTSCPGTGSYYYKLVWTGNKTYTIILPY